VPPPHSKHLHQGLTASIVAPGSPPQTIRASDATALTGPSTPRNTAELVGGGTLQTPDGSGGTPTVGNGRPTLEVHLLGQYAAAGFAARSDHHGGIMLAHTPPETPEPPWLARSS
jgi:hypothetical protein